MCQKIKHKSANIESALKNCVCKKISPKNCEIDPGSFICWMICYLKWSYRLLQCPSKQTKGDSDENKHIVDYDG